jgi:uncharacterized membrane protein YccC
LSGFAAAFALYFGFAVLLGIPSGWKRVLAAAVGSLLGWVVYTIDRDYARPKERRQS